MSFELALSLFAVGAGYSDRPQREIGMESKRFQQLLRTVEGLTPGQRGTLLRILVGTAVLDRTCPSRFCDPRWAPAEHREGVGSPSKWHLFACHSVVIRSRSRWCQCLSIASFPAEVMVTIIRRFFLTNSLRTSIRPAASSLPRWVDRFPFASPVKRHRHRKSASRLAASASNQRVIRSSIDPSTPPAMAPPPR